MRRRVLVALTVLLVGLVGAAALARHALLRAALTTGASLATGYSIDFADQRLGSSHGALLDVHVRTRSGEPVLDAKRIDLWFSPRDLLPGSRHRYGITAVAIDAPRITLIKEADGSYNVHLPQAAPPGPEAPTVPNRVPLALTVRVRNASGELLAPHAADASARRIAVSAVAIDATINSLARTQYRIDGVFDETQPQPFHARGIVDVTRGYAMHHAYAGAIPLRAIGNFIINQQTSRILGGNASHFDARAYALNFNDIAPPTYHVGASVDVSDGQMQIVGLARPIEHIRGTLQLVDDALFAPSLDARIADVPVRVSGGIYQFAAPQFRLGVSGTGDLTHLRTVLGFSAQQPVSGSARIGTLVEGSVGGPIVAVSLDSAHARYRGIPLDDVHLQLALQGGIVTILPLSARAGAAHFSVRGTLVLGDRVRSTLAAHIDAPASALPYAGVVLGDEPMTGDALVYGDGLNFEGSGAIVSRIDPQRGGAVFALARDGILDVEPAWASIDGSLLARYSLDRKNDRSAFWIDAHALRLRVPKGSSVLAASLPAVPTLDGRIDELLAAGGGTSGTSAAAAGRLTLRDAHVGGVDIANLQSGFAGTVAGMAARGVRASGSWGSIAGDGSFSTSGFAVDGEYDGTLEGLRPFLGGIEAHGGVHGPAGLAYRGGIVTVSSPGLNLVNASVRNVPVERIAGSAEIGDGRISVYSAHASVAGGDAVLAGDYATAPGAKIGQPMRLVAADLSGAGLHGAGLPIDAGTVAAAGVVSGGHPIPVFSGLVAVDRGRAQQFAVAGTGAVEFDGSSVRVRQGLGALDGTYAFLDGDIRAVDSGAPRYAVRADVPAGDIASTLHTFHAAVLPATGTFSGQLAVGGAGSAPTVQGPVRVEAGTLNGLPYTQAHALLYADVHGAAANRGAATVGTTGLRFAGAVRPGLTAAALQAPNATLSDFNNFFDTGETLGGHGSIAFAASDRIGDFSSAGSVDVAGFRYRSLPFGDVHAAWSSASGTLQGNVDAGGEKGRLTARGSIVLAPSSQWERIVSESRYAVHADLRDLDLGFWLAAVGLPEVPIEGRVDGNADVRGRYPSLSIAGTASMTNGVAYRFPIQTLSMRVSPAGNRVRIEDLHLTSQALTATGHGTLGLRPKDPLDLDVAASTNDLPRLTALWTRTTIPVSGLFEATAHIAGTWTAPRFSAGFDATNATVLGVRVDSLFGSLALDGNRLQLKNAGATFEHGDVEIAGTLPLQLQPFGIGPPDSPVSFSLAVNNLDPSVFDTALGNGTRLGGTIDGNVGIGGTVRAPRIAGTFSARNGSYVSDLERAPITALAAQLNFDATQATVSQLSARLGSGTLDGKGAVTFPDRGRGLSYTVNARANGAQLDFPQYGRGSLTGALGLVKTPDASLPVLQGEADLNDATIPFAAFLGLNGGSATPGGGAPPIDVAFDLGLKAGRNVRIRGSGLGAGLDVGATGAVRLGGDLKAPTLDGRFDATSGTLTYFDRAFRVQSAYVLFDKGSGLVPELHAVGTSHVVNPDPDRTRNPYGSVDVTIKVDGLIDNLKIAFESNPPGYSREQIIALIAPFGGFIGGVGFDSTNNATLGGVSTPGADPLPGLLKPTNYGTVTLSQEAFNILNAQFASGLLSPLETGLSQGLGLNDLSLTVDYYGNVGFSARKQLGRFVDLVYASTFGLPSRQEYGLQYAPSDVTSAQLSFFFQNGPERLFATPAGGGTSNARLTTGLPVQGQSGFSFTLQRLFW